MYVCACHLVDIGVLLAELPFVLHNGFQVRKTISDLQWKQSKTHQLNQIQSQHMNTHWQADNEEFTSPCRACGPRWCVELLHSIELFHTFVMSNVVLSL